MIKKKVPSAVLNPATDTITDKTVEAAEISKMVAVKSDNIPNELREQNCFINWQCKIVDSVCKKIPVNSKGNNINALLPRNQKSFDKAVKISDENLLGLGFVISQDTGFVCIDIDHCVDDNGKFSEIADEIVKTCDSYTEFSPSEKGLHIWIKDKDTEGIDKCRSATSGVEIYTKKRFITLTGNYLVEMPVTVEERTGMARKLVDKYIASTKESKKSKKSKKRSMQKSLSDLPLEDEDIIEKIRHSKQKDLFYELYDLGRTDRYNDDDSAADMALMNILPFWTGGNPEQMERIFSSSALAKREKWTTRQDYRERTLQAALNFWNGNCYGDSYKEEPDVLNLIRRDGKILACAENFETILREDTNLAGVLAYNVFSQKLVKKKQPPWNSDTMEWTDTDDSQLRSYISRNYDGLRNPQILDDAIIVVSHDNQFHPVREYLNNLTWDGKSRADTIFVKSLNVLDDNYARIVTRFWLKGAVARIMEPGCKFDSCLVLAGLQGSGKSTILNRLGKSWFNDSIDSIAGKDAVLQLHSGSWIIELGEMQAARKSDNEAIKAFISRQTDIVRFPYDRRTRELPRECVFAGTTNDTEPLRDKTGGRRFWILRAEGTIKDTTKRLSVITEDYIDQVWAEVYQGYLEERKQGFVNLTLPAEVMERAQELQEQSTEGSEFTAEVVQFLDTPIPKGEIWTGYNKEQRREFFILGYYTDGHGNRINGECRRNIVCSAEIANELFRVDNVNKDKSTLREINMVMNNLRTWRKLEKSKRMDIYGVQRNVYQRIEN